MPSLLFGRSFRAAAGLLVASLQTVPATAQEAETLRGRVADASGAPVAGAVVLLHAVSETSGTELDRDTADADGAFTLSYAFADGPLYFVATRVDGEIFMGEPFREPPRGELLLLAGDGVEPLRLGGATPGPAMPARPIEPRADARHGAWWVALIGAAILALVAWLVRRERRRSPRARELMLEIARLDEARANAEDTVEGDTYRARREELRARLVEALELDPDADRH